MKKQPETVHERMTREGLTMDAALQEAIRERDTNARVAAKHAVARVALEEELAEAKEDRKTLLAAVIVLEQERDEARTVARRAHYLFVGYLIEHNELSLCKNVASWDEDYPWLRENE